MKYLKLLFIILFMTCEKAVFSQDSDKRKENNKDSLKDCSSLNKEDLGNEVEAIEKLKKYRFNYEQKFETIYVRGVREAAYFSCDSGLRLIYVKTHRREFLFENVTRTVWEYFKNAASVHRYFYQYLNNHPSFSYP